jgi:hypothetical protein
MSMQGGSGAHALAKALRPTTNRLSAADARLLEESLRFGATKLFAADLEAAERVGDLQHAPSTSAPVLHAGSDAAQKAKVEPMETAAATGSPDAAVALTTEPNKASAKAGANPTGVKTGAKGGSETQSLEGPEGGDDPVEQPVGSGKEGVVLPLHAQTFHPQTVAVCRGKKAVSRLSLAVADRFFVCNNSCTGIKLSLHYCMFIPHIALRSVE